MQMNSKFSNGITAGELIIELEKLPKDFKVLTMGQEYNLGLFVNHEKKYASIDDWEAYLDYLDDNWRSVKLNEIQDNIRREFSFDSDFGNGHAFYAVCGLSRETIGSFLELLDREEKDNGYNICLLDCTSRAKQYTISFHTHEKYASDLALNLSKKCPDLNIYRNDCWDHEGEVELYKYGKWLSLKDNIDAFSHEPTEYKAELVTNEKSDADPKMYDCSAVVTDLKSGYSFMIGGGCLSAEQRENILTLVKLTNEGSIDKTLDEKLTTATEKMQGQKNVSKKIERGER